MATPVIEAEGLVKTFGDFTAGRRRRLRGQSGEVFRVAQAQRRRQDDDRADDDDARRPDAGAARVAGHDVIRDPEAVRASMGLTAQSATVDELLTGQENPGSSGIQGPARRVVRARADELLERFSR